MPHAAKQLDQKLDRAQSLLPRRLAAMLEWLRRPQAKWVRIPAGILLIVGSVFGFLPILGFWMLPLGLMLIALDVPQLRPPLAKALALGERGVAWTLRQWRRLKAKVSARA